MSVNVGITATIDGKLLKEFRIKLAIMICNIFAKLFNIKMRLSAKEENKKNYEIKKT